MEDDLQKYRLEYREEGEMPIKMLENMIKHDKHYKHKMLKIKVNKK